MYLITLLLSIFMTPVVNPSQGNCADVEQSADKVLDYTRSVRQSSKEEDIRKYMKLAVTELESMVAAAKNCSCEEVSESATEALEEAQKLQKQKNVMWIQEDIEKVDMPTDDASSYAGDCE